MNRGRLFVETADGPTLAGLACRACGRVSFPARWHCPHCLVPGAKVGLTHCLGGFMHGDACAVGVSVLTR